MKTLFCVVPSKCRNQLREGVHEGAGCDHMNFTSAHRRCGKDTEQSVYTDTYAHHKRSSIQEDVHFVHGAVRDCGRNAVGQWAICSGRCTDLGICDYRVTLRSVDWKCQDDIGEHLLSRSELLPVGIDSCCC